MHHLSSPAIPPPPTAKPVMTDLFASQGFAETTVAMIAKRAKVATPTVYATFGSKAAIVGEIVGGLEAEANRDRWGARIQAEPDPLLKLGLYAAFLRQLYANGRDAWAAAVTDKVATPCESSSSVRASAG